MQYIGRPGPLYNHAVGQKRTVTLTVETSPAVQRYTVFRFFSSVIMIVKSYHIPLKF